MHGIGAAVFGVILAGMSINDEPPSTYETDYIWYQMPFQLVRVDKTIYFNEVDFQVTMVHEGRPIEVEIKIYTPYSKEMFEAAVNQAADAVLVQGNQWKSNAIPQESHPQGGPSY